MKSWLMIGGLSKVNWMLPRAPKGIWAAENRRCVATRCGGHCSSCRPGPCSAGATEGRLQGKPSGAGLPQAGPTLVGCSPQHTCQQEARPCQEDTGCLFGFANARLFNKAL